MPNYRRNYLDGGCYFFTVNLKNRQKSYLTDNIQLLREAVSECRSSMPFIIHAWVVLPDHMHAIWTLPAGDADYSRRWRFIKKHFTKGLAEPEKEQKNSRGERGIWQRRFWEHTIRDQEDFDRHFDYIHFNPVKHGWVSSVCDWPFSSFHRAARDGIYPHDWGRDY